MTKPNLFIIGAPKCGTTAMAHYLSEHPDVFMCPEKEPHYFNTDLNHKRGLSDDLEEYLNLFADAGDEKIIGEASVWYLYSREAVKNIDFVDLGTKNGTTFSDTINFY